MASTSNNNGGGGAGGAVNKIDRAHQMYRDGRYEDALGFYTEALSVAKTNPQKIALHSNRAACYLKLHNFKMAAEECTWVLELDHDHTGALMLRAQTLVTLKEYNSALFDVNRLIELNPSSEVYRNLLARLKTQLSLAPIPEDDAELEEDDEDETELQVDNVEKEREGVEECEDGGRQVIGAVVAKEQKAEVNGATPRSGVTTCNRSIEGIEECEDGGRQVVDAVVAKEQMAEVNGATPRSGVTTQNRSIGKSSEQESSGWQAIPKPKGHSQLDYSRWDRVEDESSEEDDEDDDDDESQPQYRFRVRTVGVRAVK